MRERIKWPALSLVFLGVFNLALSIGSFVLGWLTFARPSEVYDVLKAEGVQEHQLRWLGHFLRVLFIGFPIVQIALSSFVVFAGVQMLNLRMRWAALAASFLVMLPCLSPCVSFVIGFFIGGWALVHLIDIDVKRAFERGDVVPPI